MLYYNANGSLKDNIIDVWYNANGTLKRPQEIWYNANGTLKLIWPDGIFTNMRTVFNAGVYHVDNAYDSHGQINDGRASFGINDFYFKSTEYKANNEYDINYWVITHVWFLTQSKINLSPFSTLDITIKYKTMPSWSGSGNNYGQANINFITSDTNIFNKINGSWSIPSQIKQSKTIISAGVSDDYKEISKSININDLQGEHYIGFDIYGTYSDGWRTGSGVEGYITKIQLKR